MTTLPKKTSSSTANKVYYIQPRNSIDDIGTLLNTSLRNRALPKLNHDCLVSFLTFPMSLILVIKFEKSNIPKCNCPKLSSYVRQI